MQADPKRRILFVCHGNICRSPMAEYLLKKMAADAGRSACFEIDSAAVSTEELGHDVYPPARQCLERHGVPCPRRAARQISQADLQHFDQIFVMDHDNLRRLQHMGLGNYARKVSLVMSLAGSPRDVADPWYTGNFEQTFQDLLQALPHLL